MLPPPAKPLKVEAVAAESLGRGNVIPMIADVARDKDCARVVAMAHDRFGRLDILINNAGRGMKYVSERFLTEGMIPESGDVLNASNKGEPVIMDAGVHCVALLAFSLCSIVRARGLVLR